MAEKVWAAALRSEQSRFEVRLENSCDLLLMEIFVGVAERFWLTAGSVDRRMNKKSFAFKLLPFDGELIPANRTVRSSWLHIC
jgi:hypothetical protein